MALGAGAHFAGTPPAVGITPAPRRRCTLLPCVGRDWPTPHPRRFHDAMAEWLGEGLQILSMSVRFRLASLEVGRSLNRLREPLKPVAVRPEMGVTLDDSPDPDF